MAFAHHLFVATIATVVSSAVSAAPMAHAQAAPPKRDRPALPKRGPSTPPPPMREYATGTIVAIEEIAFDPYWRDASLSLADALQPLADIVSRPAANDSFDEVKRRTDAKAIAAEVRTLRENAAKPRRLWVIWVAEPKAKSVAFVLSENRREIVDDLKVGRSINSEMFAAKLSDGFATRLTPLGDDDAANAKDVKAAAAIMRDRWIPTDVKTVRTGLKKEPKAAPIGGFDAPAWHEGADAIKAVKVEIGEPKGDAASKSGRSEVTVRFRIPQGQGDYSKIAFRLYEKNPDGTRGRQVANAKGDGDFIAWGYANRPALAQVPVTTPHASGYDVEIVSSRYR